MKSRFRRTGLRGLTVLEVISVVGVLFILAMILLPAIARRYGRVSRVSCMNQLKQVGLAFRIWAGDHGNEYPMQISTIVGGTRELIPTENVFPHFRVMSNELASPKVLVSPQDAGPMALLHSTLNFKSDFTDKRISYFIDLDAADTNSIPVLAGDRNLIVGGVAAKRGLITLMPDDHPGWTSLIHSNRGNVALVDGSVQTFTSLPNREANRLVIP